MGSPEKASKAGNKMRIVVGQVYRHRGRNVLVAESDGGGIWLSPTDPTDATEPYHLPWHRFGEIEEPADVE